MNNRLRYYILANCKLYIILIYTTIEITYIIYIRMYRFVGVL